MASQTLFEPSAAGAYVAPRNDHEWALTAIWAETLELDRVGVHDNSFDIGGRSLLAIKKNYWG